MEPMSLILLIVLVVIIAIVVVIYLFTRKKDKDDGSESKKDKKNTKGEINEKLDELVSKKDDATDKETRINKVEIDDETNNLGKELIDEGVMDESALEDDLAGIDEMFLEDSDEDIEEIKDATQKDKKVKTTRKYNTFDLGGGSGGSDGSLFKELEKLSKYEKKDEYNIMRDLKGADFDTKDLENELKSVIKEIDKVKRKKSKKKR